MFSKNKTRCVPTLGRVLAVTLSLVLIIVLAAGCVPADTGTATAGGEEGSNPTFFESWGVLIINAVGIIAVFYFLMIRPEQKRKKQAEDMRNSLAIGDNVTTIGGITGKIVNISDEFITFETGEDRVRIKIAKWGISSTGKDAAEPEQKAGN